MSKPTDIAAYAHTLPCASEQEADPREGYYYVSVRDGARHGLLLGPFVEHQDALDWVDRVTAFVRARQPWSAFYAFGTCRIEDLTLGMSAHQHGKISAGNLNQHFPEAAALLFDLQSTQTLAS